MRKLDYDAGEFFRFLGLQALLEENGQRRLSLPEWQEYQRLLGEYGEYPIDAVRVGPADPVCTPRAVAILQSDCQPIPGEDPLICPRSEPRLPVGLLPHVEQHCRELGRVGGGGTVLWVGRQAEIETICMWDHGCRCFSPTERVERFGHAAAALLREVGQILQKAPAREEFASALERTQSLVRVLKPLGTIYKSDSGPAFPSRELALAFLGLSGALEIFRKHVTSETSTGTDAGLMAQSLERLASAAAEFHATARYVWPVRLTETSPVLRTSEDGQHSEPSAPHEVRAIGLLVFEPGAFLYKGHRQELSGKPLQVLEALTKAKGNVLTLAALRGQCWDDAVIGEEAVRSAVKTARAALRQALHTSGVKGAQGFNPIPVVDRGTGRTAWRLLLP